MTCSGVRNSPYNYVYFMLLFDSLDITKIYQCSFIEYVLGKDFIQAMPMKEHQ